MSKIFSSQTKLTIVLNCGTPITGVTTALIKYRKPDGTTGSFTASVLDATAGTISYDVASAADINIYGNWSFWAFLTYADGKTITGQAAQLQVYKEGN